MLVPWLDEALALTMLPVLAIGDLPPKVPAQKPWLSIDSQAAFLTLYIVDHGEENMAIKMSSKRKGLPLNDPHSGF